MQDVRPTVLRPSPAPTSSPRRAWSSWPPRPPAAGAASRRRPAPWAAPPLPSRRPCRSRRRPRPARARPPARPGAPAPRHDVVRRPTPGSPVLPWEAGETGEPSVQQWLLDHKLAVPAAARAEGSPGWAPRAPASPSRGPIRPPWSSTTAAPSSPLRIRTRGDDLVLPLALTAAAPDQDQDLVVLVLAPDRYAPIGTDHTFAPTGLAVSDSTVLTFAETYDSLIRTVARPNTVLTEYAWPAATCDPCAVPPLDRSTVGTLGGYLVRGASPARWS
ncbi:MAG: DUF2330 domain-containing protein [Myxococcota bacterium]